MRPLGLLLCMTLIEGQKYHCRVADKRRNRASSYPKMLTFEVTVDVYIAKSAPNEIPIIPAKGFLTLG